MGNVATREISGTKQEMSFRKEEKRDFKKEGKRNFKKEGNWW